MWLGAMRAIYYALLDRQWSIPILLIRYGIYQFTAHEREYLHLEHGQQQWHDSCQVVRFGIPVRGKHLLTEHLSGIEEYRAC